MFTVEFEPDAAVIVTLDETETCEDVETVIADDGIVFFRQYEESLDNHQLITMTYHQLLDIVAALHSKEGAYYVERKHNFIKPR